MCEECLQLVAAVQLELGTNAAFTQALVARTEWACEGLAPSLAQQVRVLFSCWARELLLQLSGSSPADCGVGRVVGCPSTPGC